jgi:hypothetical protein
MSPVIRPTDDLARLHLETAVALKGLAFVQDWVNGQGQASQQLSTPTQESGRGRKPGAAAPEIRCAWALVAGGQCKNTKIVGSEYCKIHVGKASAISAAAAVTGVAPLPSS